MAAPVAADSPDHAAAATCAAAISRPIPVPARVLDMPRAACGSSFAHFYLGYNVVDSMYLAIVTGASIGYGSESYGTFKSGSPSQGASPAGYPAIHYHRSRHLASPKPPKTVLAQNRHKCPPDLLSPPRLRNIRAPCFQATL